MKRMLFSLVLAAVLAAGPAFGQGFTRPLPTPPPIPIPGTRQLYPADSLLVPRFVTPAVPFGFAPWGVAPGYIGGWGGYYVVPSVLPGRYFMGPPSDAVPVIPPLQGAGGPTTTRRPPEPELPAELTIEFPAVPTVTLNGATVPGEGSVRTLQSPPLKPGQSYRFAVTANWTIQEQRYQWERTVTLGPGERSRIVVARGFPIRDE